MSEKNHKEPFSKQHSEKVSRVLERPQITQCYLKKYKNEK